MEPLYKMSRLLMLQTFITLCQHVIMNRRKQLTVTSHHSKMLYNHSYRNISNTKMTECLEQCLSDCLCQSFQICNHQCQLCSSNKYLTPSDWRGGEKCVAFEFWSNATEKKFDFQQYENGCITSLNCCMTSNPCLNGGKCGLTQQNSKQRFLCKCTNGYEGYQCEKETNRSCSPGYKGENCDKPITSCRECSNGDRLPGYYTILSPSTDKPVTVFCDFGLNITWTLVQSYSLENKDQFQEPFFVNSPVEPNQPSSWERYRLFKARLISIMSDSTKWRFTCNYDSNDVVHVDYVQGLFSELDIINFDGSECVEVEYIAVRGLNCSKCKVGMKQSRSIPLHITVSIHCGSFLHTGVKFCDYESYEDNFGFYECINKNHSCSSSPSATTQLWFGG